MDLPHEMMDQPMLLGAWSPSVVPGICIEEISVKNWISESFQLSHRGQHRTKALGELLHQYHMAGPLHHLKTFFTLAAPNELANLGNQNIHGSHSPAIVICSHVEGFDGLGVVVHNDWLLEDLLSKVALVLT